MPCARRCSQVGRSPQSSSQTSAMPRIPRAPLTLPPARAATPLDQRCFSSGAVLLAQQARRARGDDQGAPVRHLPLGRWCPGAQNRRARAQVLVLRCCQGLSAVRQQCVASSGCGKAEQLMVSGGRGLPAGAPLARCTPPGREMAGETAGGRGAEGGRDSGGPCVLGRPREAEGAHGVTVWHGLAVVRLCGVHRLSVGCRLRCVGCMNIRGSALAPRSGSRSKTSNRAEKARSRHRPRVAITARAGPLTRLTGPERALRRDIAPHCMESPRNLRWERASKSVAIEMVVAIVQAA